MNAPGSHHCDQPTGGADTTASSATALLYVLSNYPKIQAKAQAEIDEIIGRDRLPAYCDQENLPYVQAMIQEVCELLTTLRPSSD